MVFFRNITHKLLRSRGKVDDEYFKLFGFDVATYVLRILRFKGFRVCHCPLYFSKPITGHTLIYPITVQ